MSRVDVVAPCTRGSPGAKHFEYKLECLAMRASREELQP